MKELNETVVPSDECLRGHKHHACTTSTHGSLNLCSVLRISGCAKEGSFWIEYCQGVAFCRIRNFNTSKHIVFGE